MDVGIQVEVAAITLSSGCEVVVVGYGSGPNYEGPISAWIPAISIYRLGTLSRAPSLLHAKQIIAATPDPEQSGVVVCREL